MQRVRQFRNASNHFWFTLIVYSIQSRENEERGRYPTTCYTQEPCMLYCPDVNIPRVNSSNITSHSITWDKKGNSSPTQNYFLSVEEEDSGVYTCTRSYVYDGQIYNMTFTVVLDVKPSKQIGQSVILAPKQNDVFPVDLGSTVVIECKADLYSNADIVFWLSGDTFVETDDNLPVFYNESQEEYGDKIKMTTFLIFKEVSEEDLSKNFTCKLQSDHQLSSFVTITLTHKARSVSLLMPFCIVGIMVLVIIIVATGCAKFKIDIALFLRDTFGCYVNSSDVKSYDAYLLSYNSAQGLSEGDRRWLESVLEERFGYSLCLFNYDALPEKAGAEAVITCTEQSRSVVLVPSSSNSDPGSDLLNNILAILVERQTHLVFIIPEIIQVSNRNSRPEALKHLRENRNCVIWKDRKSKEHNSSFLKMLRYYLHAPQHATRVLRHTKSDVV
ncbi:interleukin-18 receptor 1-like isoform X2 [Melanotaenia boesemani]|uniref:interleukin-18 receptor 1-like isoform X2 n=1 Tax=Melanotaenia boesemani TaxID=1250792 RepID=UPI001C04F390|nr:interleukin-18 receptor 1-like isoform X2 [Melanotaenia boesemani]